MKCVFKHQILQIFVLKRLRGMTSLWYFNLYEAMYPAEHDLIFFKIFRFKKTFFINISKNPEITQTNYLYTKRMR